MKSLSAFTPSTAPPAEAYILAVDDEDANLQLIELSLSPLSLPIQRARSAEAAWKLAQQHPPLLVLLDRVLPGEDGLSLLKRMRKEPTLRHVPVIMQSACARHADLLDGLRAGAAFYVTKPIDPDALLSLARGALRISVTQRIHRVASPLVSALRAGQFEFRTLADAHALALELGQLCPNSEQVVLGLTELMINAIEHGNLGITCEEKGQLCLSDTWQQEVQRRLDLPEFRARVARVFVARDADGVRFEVHDEGQGFAWRRFLRFEVERADQPNGRGIALARGLAFSELYYREPGNVVVAEVRYGGRE
jgi:DNA-binding response OmpR family regulator